MDSAVPPKVYEILKKITNGDIQNFEINIQDPNKKGEGYLGRMFFVSLRDKRNGSYLNVVVKQAFSEQKIRDQHPIRDVFHNEIYFYKTLWPALQQFQSRIPLEYHFANVPKYFGAISEDNFERLVLENLKYQGYVMHDKKKPLQRDMFEFIFKVYGKFHAISFAYKTLQPEEFSELSKELIDVWYDYSEKDGFRSAIDRTHKETLNILQESKVDDAIIEKYRHYVNDGVDMFRRSYIVSKYTTVTHGDCWSNNMMFKFDKSNKLVDLKFLDFQITRVGSPICDLSYCLYSGGTKEVFDDLDHLLQVYHDSLSENLRAYGCDPNQVYPMEVLKRDWKTYCQLGITMGLMLWRAKLTHEDDMLDLTDLSENDDSGNKFFETKYDKKTFMERTKDIILHLYETDYLF